MNDYYVVDRNRWLRRSIFEQMGNIGSEVGRSFQAKRLGDKEKSEQAMVRALDLFDATISQLIKARSPRAKEVLRAREEYLGVLYGRGTSDKDTYGINRYFLQFAIAARITR